MVLPHLPAARSLQNSLMTEECKVTRHGVIVQQNIPCRIHSGRLFTETPDPQDANVRSMFEWGWTMPWTFTDVEVSDTISKQDDSLVTIIGEVLKHDTWRTATRVWSTRPKDAVPTIEIVLKRLDYDADLITIGTYQVSIHYDRNQPVATPPRYAPVTVAAYKSGTVACADMSFVPQVGDRFAVIDEDDPTLMLGCVITAMLPGQPQRREARFEADITGSRI